MSHFATSHFDRFMRFLSRVDRLHIVMGVLMFLGGSVVFASAKYTIVEHEYYRSLADRQQTSMQRDPITRGAIYSSAQIPNGGPRGVFAVSTDLGDLAIDPQAPGSKSTLKTFLTSLVMREYCEAKSDHCLEDIARWAGVKLEIIPTDRVLLEAFVLSEISQKVDKQFVDFVLIKEALTIEEKTGLAAFGTGGLYLIRDNLYVDPTAISNSGIIAEPLSQLLSLPRADIDFKLSLRSARYVKVIKKMSFATKDLLDERINNERMSLESGLLSEENSIFKFFIIEPQPTRFYPERTIGGQILGFVDNAGIGRYGIEGYFHDQLQSQDVGRLVKQDSRGNFIGGYDLETLQNEAGVDIELTIDRNIQKEITAILERGVKDFRANRGTAVVMDPKTGAIRAMVNYPDFDPNSFSEVYEMEKITGAKYPNPRVDLLWVPMFVEDSEKGFETTVDGKTLRLRQATDTERTNSALIKYIYKNKFWPGVYTNDAVGSLYEPGSVFKSITVAIGIDNGDIRPGDFYLDKGSVDIDTFTISNISKNCLGRNTYMNALNWSCNVGLIDIVKKIGAPVFDRYIRDFGFGAKTHVTIDGETFSTLDPVNKWSRTKLFTMSFGQGITATVMQMAAAYSVLANGGVYMRPYLIEKIRLNDGREIVQEPEPLRRVIKESTSKTVAQMLADGAINGFARSGAVPGYKVAGKTGTSQIASKGTYECSRSSPCPEGNNGHTITSYGWFAPYDNPKFVLIVKLERPRTNQYSETTTSVLWRQISQYLLSYYGVPAQK